MTEAANDAATGKGFIRRLRRPVLAGPVLPGIGRWW